MFLEGPILRDSPFAPAVEAPHPANPGLIGPNAVLKTLDVMRERLDASSCAGVLRDARLERAPSGEDMIPEIEAMRLHRWLAMHEPVECLAIAQEAGARTADYIIANRIPAPARLLLRCLPATLAAPLLMKAIRAHAWTFIGSGAFSADNAWHFRIDRTEADDAIMPTESLFVWYSAVFERLYQRLVHPGARCRDLGADDLHPMAHRFRLGLDRQQ